jgi:hypothetical protein
MGATKRRRTGSQRQGADAWGAGQDIAIAAQRSDPASKRAVAAGGGEARKVSMPRHAGSHQKARETAKPVNFEHVIYEGYAPPCAADGRVPDRQREPHGPEMRVLFRSSRLNVRLRPDFDHVGCD